MTARDVTGCCRFSLPGNRAIFSRFWGDFLTKLHRKSEEKKEGELWMENNAWIADFCRLWLVVIKRVLSHTWVTSGLLFPFELLFSASPKPHPAKPHPCNMAQAKNRSCTAIFGSCAAETALQHSLFCSADIAFTKSCAATNEELHCNIGKPWQPIPP